MRFYPPDPKALRNENLKASKRSDKSEEMASADYYGKRESTPREDKMSPEQRADKQFQEEHKFWTYISDEKKANYMRDVRNTLQYQWLVLKFTTQDSLKAIYHALIDK